MQYPTLVNPDVRIGMAKTDVICHSPRRSLLRFGARICEHCGKRWGKSGCQPFRDAVVLLVTHAARTGRLSRLWSDIRIYQAGHGCRPTRRSTLQALGGGLYRTGVAA